MSQPPEVRELLAPMIDRPVDLEGPGFRVDRERVLARMSAAGKRERRGFLGYALLAAAIAVVFIGGARLVLREGGWGSTASLDVLVSEGSATQSHGTLHSAVEPNRNTHIAAAGELETAAGSQAKIRTTDGLQIELASDTRVALGELQPRSSQVKLLGGAIRCTIPHRTVAHPFQVVTSDVTVVDLGTVFTVTIEGPNHATRVSVEEGEVLVRHGGEQTRVQAPSSWSSAPVLADPPASITPPEPAPSAPASSASAVHSTTKRLDAAPAATLAEEAQLLRQGLAAERQGRRTDAISSFTQLLSKYPHSPLVPEARSALARVEASPAK